VEALTGSAIEIPSRVSIYNVCGTRLGTDGDS
jgi:hypothetical protein